MRALQCAIVRAGALIWINPAPALRAERKPKSVRKPFAPIRHLKIVNPCSPVLRVPPTARLLLPLLLLLLLLLPAAVSMAQEPAAFADWHWNPGAADCKTNPPPPVEVRRYDPKTFVLRENPCATFEAPFMYLLIGADKALLIDSGDVADPHAVPLAKTAIELLPGPEGLRLPLLVAHTHRHLDHRAGDAQFAIQPGVELVPYDLEGMRRFYGFKDWPNDNAQIDLGGRIVDVIPAPGHNPTELVFYDPNTALVLSGDFLLPGRLLVEDAAAYAASARRVADFFRERPVSAVLGGHVEFDNTGATFDWGAQYHPNEHSLALTKADLLALPAAMASFNGFYSRSGPYVMMNPTRNLCVVAGGTLLLLAAAVALLVRWIVRRRRSARQAALAAI
jgi:glyoxylase-like metal-dependent hydrolase (beta-lactamase superfamily II)